MTPWRTRYHSRTHRRQRGMTLVEAMLAFAAAGAGMLAMMASQSQLRLHGDVTRQRAEAVQLGEAEMEKLRAFASMAAFADLPSQPASVTSGLASDAVFTVQRRLVAQGSLLRAEVDVQWSDRSGAVSTISLDSLIAGVDPGLSGALASPPAHAGESNAYNRAAAVPPQAADLGDGRSAFLPPNGNGVTWVFDNQSGVVTSVCMVAPGTVQAGLTSTALTHCTAAAALPLAGHVRFSTGATVTAANAELPASPALDLDMALTLTEGTAASPACFDDAGSAPGQTDVAVYCLVTPDASSRHWSGRLDVQPIGWTPGHAAGSYRVCRYSADYDGLGGVTNDEHPLSYAAVAGPLANQNFLVVAGQNACPTDVPANPAHGDMVDSNTVEQAPSPTPTPSR